MKLPLNSMLLAPLVVFVTFTFIVSYSFFVATDTVKEEKEKIAIEKMDETENAITTHFEVYDELVRSGVGLFSASDSVTKEDWKNFIEATSVLDRFQGVQVVGYASVINSSDIDQFESISRQNIKTDFAVNPRVDSEVYAPVTYINPEDEQNIRTYGFDMYSDPLRYETMIAARDNDDVYLTEALKLRFNTTPDDQFGFLLIAPFYATGMSTDTTEQRESALEGYVYTGFKSKEFLGSTLGILDEDYLGYEIVASNADQQVSLYESSNYSELVSRAGIKNSRNITIKGANWQLNYVYNVPDDKLFPSLAQRPLAILIFGIFFALLTAGFVYLLIFAKSRDLALVKEREIIDAKDNLLSIASHQLRTPATGVKQYLGLVLQGFSGDISNQQQILLQKAFDSNERQLKTINEVLYLARLDSGRIILSKTKVDIVDLVNSILNEVNDSIIENKHKVTLVKPKYRVIVQADEHMIRMAAENIITNAIKYTKPKGKITISIKNHKQQIFIKVKDSGVGIKGEDMNLLFKQFIRVPNELSKSVSGTGIGLFLANHLIELHNGSITLNSTYTKGTVFTILIPKT